MAHKVTRSAAYSSPGPDNGGKDKVTILRQGNSSFTDRLVVLTTLYSREGIFSLAPITKAQKGPRKLNLLPPDLIL